MNTFTYTCPSCDSELSVKETDRVVTCPECEQRIRIDFDCDYENGRWVDCTKLSVEGE